MQAEEDQKAVDGHPDSEEVEAEAGGSPIAAPPRKPFLTVEQQIAHLKSKGVTFDRCTEEEAAEYLAHTNNYLRATSYRKLYPIRLEGKRAGEYIGLDFEAFRQLSSADRTLRAALREIAIDVEHFAHMRLLELAATRGEDGYAIIRDYLAGLSSRGQSRVAGSLSWRGREGSSHDEYVGDLIAHYMDGDYPLWVFLEAIEFGRFCDLWLFCANRWGDAWMLDQHYVLKSTKAIRNASCHNCCIINGFSASANKAHFPTSSALLNSLNIHGFKNSKLRKKKLSNLRIAQIAATLYASSEFCTDDLACRNHAALMFSVKSSFKSVRELCPADGSLTSYFDFISKLVDIWTPARA